MPVVGKGDQGGRVHKVFGSRRERRKAVVGGGWRNHQPHQRQPGCDGDRRSRGDELSAPPAPRTSHHPHPPAGGQSARGGSFGGGGIEVVGVVERGGDVQQQLVTIREHKDGHSRVSKHFPKLPNRFQAISVTLVTSYS